MITVRRALDQLVTKAGMSEKDIGKAIARDQSSVNRMRRGKQTPDFPTGQRIIRLHEKKCVQLAG